MTRLWTSLRVGEKEKNLNCSKYSPLPLAFWPFFLCRCCWKQQLKKAARKLCKKPRFGVPGVYFNFSFFLTFGPSREIYIFFFTIHIWNSIFVVCLFQLVNCESCCSLLSSLSFCAFCLSNFLVFLCPYLGSVSDILRFWLPPSPFRMSLGTVLNYLVARSNAPELVYSLASVTLG